MKTLFACFFIMCFFCRSPFSFSYPKDAFKPTDFRPSSPPQESAAYCLGLARCSFGTLYTGTQPCRVISVTLTGPLFPLRGVALIVVLLVMVLLFSCTGPGALSKILVLAGNLLLFRWPRAVTYLTSQFVRESVFSAFWA